MQKPAMDFFFCAGCEICYPADARGSDELCVDCAADRYMAFADMCAVHDDHEISLCEVK